MKKLLLLILPTLFGCATVPASYVKRLERLEREVMELREETKRLREEAKRLKESLSQTEEYERRIREEIGEEYRRKGRFIRPPKAK